MCPSGFLQAHYKFSTDLVNWETSPEQTYSYEVEYVPQDHLAAAGLPLPAVNRTTHLYWRVERPQLFFSRTNATDLTVSAPTVLYNGVCGNDKTGDGADVCLFKQGGMVFTIARELNAN
jgi:hypothetical protein